MYSTMKQSVYAMSTVITEAPRLAFYIELFKMVIKMKVTGHSVLVYSLYVGWFQQHTLF